MLLVYQCCIHDLICSVFNTVVPSRHFQFTPPPISTVTILSLKQEQICATSPVIIILPA